jgi:hypothetical protein
MRSSMQCFYSIGNNEMGGDGARHGRIEMYVFNVRQPWTYITVFSTALFVEPMRHPSRCFELESCPATGYGRQHQV